MEFCNPRACNSPKCVCPDCPERPHCDTGRCEGPILDCTVAREARVAAGGPESVWETPAHPHGGEGLALVVEPSPAEFMRLSLPLKWAIKSQLSATLNEVLPEVTCYRDLDRVLQVARDYGLYLEHRGTKVRLQLLVMPAWSDKGLAWEDAVEQELNTDLWPEAQYYTDPDSLCAAVPIADLHRFFEFLG